MRSGYSRLPIAAAKRLAADYSLRQVILIGLNSGDDTAHVVTFGKSVDDCRLAAESGNNLKRHMGWPEHLCSGVPARIKRSGHLVGPDAVIVRLAPSDRGCLPGLLSREIAVLEGRPERDRDAELRQYISHLRMCLEAVNKAREEWARG
jgi:hypothetical protein